VSMDVIYDNDVGAVEWLAEDDDADDNDDNDDDDDDDDDTVTFYHSSALNSAYINIVYLMN